VEQIWHDTEVSICCKLVRNELCVDEPVANDIGQDYDGVVGGFGGWEGEVHFICLVMYEYAAVHNWGEWNLLPPTCFISPTASPSCLTPMVQH
jgi:hypothetical protein